MTAVATDLVRSRCAGTSCGDVLVFRGVPYAAAPTGERRWRPPQPAASWAGVRDATAFGPIAPQDISPERLAKRGLTMSEDCLTLNIWTPAADDNRRPVLVFLHGGGQTQGYGSAPLIDGSRLARRGDIVVVTMNFRLGALGALYAPDWHGADSTNLTLRDQRHALQWVREQIGAFGGDPGAVTVAGQSSGAIAISALLAGRVRPLRSRDPAERRPGARPLHGGCLGRGRAVHLRRAPLRAPKSRVSRRSLPRSAASTADSCRRRARSIPASTATSSRSIRWWSRGRRHAGDPRPRRDDARRVANL